MRRSCSMCSHENRWRALLALPAAGMPAGWRLVVVAGALLGRLVPCGWDEHPAGKPGRSLCMAR